MSLLLFDRDDMIRGKKEYAKLGVEKSWKLEVPRS